MMSVVKSTIVAAALAVGSMAQAATVTVEASHTEAEAGANHLYGLGSEQLVGNANYGTPAVFQLLWWTIPYVADNNQTAGRFDLTSSGQQFYAFSLAPDNSSNLASSYETSVTLASSSQSEYLSRLYSLYYASLSTDDEAVAFQMAIWEIMSDTALDTGAGNFRDNGGNNATVSTLFQDFVNGVTSAPTTIAADYSFTYYDGADGADLLEAKPIIPQAVPLPAAGLSLVSGLAALALWRRRFRTS